ncbi:MAG: hypothetical protein HQK49_12610 [Oligoflexia bacterium]|nr:hypothetical protein [Oligoflexia bacterium]
MINPSTYILALDGTEIFRSKKICCNKCLTKISHKESSADQCADSEETSIEYYHQIIGGALYIRI